MTVTATDRQVPPNRGSVYLLVNVLRDSTGPTVFELRLFSETISESKPVNETVSIAVARPGVNIRYSLDGTPLAERFFYIDPITGVIRVRADLRLDTFNTTTYNLNVVATRRDPQDTNPLVVRGRLPINVRRKEGYPQFLDRKYERFINDTHDVGTPVLTVSAVDTDGDAVEYSIASQTAPILDFFFMNTYTGELILKRPLVGTPYSRFEFTVQASKAGRPDRFSRVQVIINIRRDSSRPIFQQGTYAVNITAYWQIGQQLITVVATDPDRRGDIVYELVGDGLSPAFFAVNRTTGEITLVGGPNFIRDTTTQYFLRIIAYDTVYPQNQASQYVVVNVLRNQYGPVFNQTAYTAQLPINSQLGSPIVQLSASDLDINDTLTYEIVGRPEAFRLFYVNPDTGLLSLKSALPRAQTPYQIILVVQVRDNGNPARYSQATVTITVVDNQQIVFVGQPYSANIRRTDPVGQVVLRVVGRSNSQVGQIRFELVGEYPTPNFFSINSTTGEISISRPLGQDVIPQERTARYQATIAAYLDSSPEDRTQVTALIVVDRNPNAPRFLRGTYDSIIKDTLAPGDTILPLSAVDDDNDTVRYRLDGSAEIREQFFVDPVLGGVYLKKAFALTQSRLYSFTVTAYDVFVPSRSVQINVVITVEATQTTITTPSVTPSPQPDRIFALNVTDITPINWIIANINVSNTIWRGPTRYNATGTFAAQRFFTINNQNGSMTVIRNLRETDQDVYTFNILAYDDFNHSLTLTLEGTIQIIRNPNPPEFIRKRYTTTIRDTHRLSDMVLNITAFDRDQDRLTYELSAVKSVPPALNYFDIDSQSGILFLRQRLSLDPARNRRYLMTVMVRDNHYPERTAEATIEVTVRRDENNPRFDRPTYTANVSSSAVNRTVVITVRATDGDTWAGPMVYELVGNALARYYFGIDSTRGIVYVRNDLSTDSSTTYTLVVRAYQQQYPDNDATATILVRVDRNQYTPIFEGVPYQREISVDTRPGTNVFTVSASDRDGDRIIYGLIPSGDQRFFINTLTGQIFTVGTLNQNVTSYQLNVTATDQGNPPNVAWTVVTLTLGKSSFLPQWVNVPGSVNISESQRPNTVVYTLSATDRDLQGQMRYGMRGDSNTISYFSINPGNGQIRLVVPLTSDSTDTPYYNAVVFAYDSSRPDQQIEGIVRIMVDRNPDPPSFGVFDRNITIRRSTTPLTVITTVVASDPQGTDVFYSILTPSPYLFINPRSGEIILQQALTDESITRFNLNVQACDNGVPFLCAVAQVIINIDDANKTPFFEISSYTHRIPDTQPLGRLGLRLSAVDRDLQGTMRYEVVLPDPAARFFGIDNSGQLLLQQSVLNEQPTQYQFRVAAYDSAFPTMKGYASVTVFVDRGSKPPTFPTDLYVIYINETASTGDLVETITANGTGSDTFVYSLVGSQVDEDTFYVNPTTGALFLNRPLTDVLVRDINTFVFAVRVTESASGKSGVATVIVNVIRDRSPPVFPRDRYDVTINETKPVNEGVVTLVATDPDLKGRIIYEATNVYPAPEFFGVRPSGQVYVRRSLTEDSLQLRIYELVVEAYDSRYPLNRTQATVFITVRRGARGVSFQPSATYEARISSCDPSTGSIIQTVRATAEDGSSAGMRYSFVNSSLAIRQMFTINPTTGVITNLRPLNQAAADFYTLIVRATDPLGRTALGIVNVILNCRSEPPVFPGGSVTIIVNVTDPVRTRIHNVTAVDPDSPPGELRYEIVGVDPSPEFFEIDSRTGVIYLKKQLSTDPRQLQVYVIRIEAYSVSDPNTRSSYDLIVRVDRNPNSPELSANQYEATVRENFPLGGSVLAISASDRDGDVIWYEIYTANNNPQGLAAIPFFYLNPGTGVITVRRDLREAPNNLYTFTVVARDQGLPPNEDTAVVRITVERASRVTILNPSTQISINETEPVNQRPIHTVRATIQGVSGNPVYEATGVGAAQLFFRVDRTTGQVYVLRDLKTDTLTRYEKLQVQPQCSLQWCVIPASRSSRTIFGAYERTIDDTYPPGNVVVPVRASDPDGDIVQFSLEGPAVALEYFFIVPRSGDIILQKSLRGTSLRRIQMTAVASDLRPNPRSARASVIINIRPVGDGPRFQNLPYEVSVNEEETINKAVFNVRAVDNLPTGQIVYEVVDDLPVSRLFAVNRSSGIITVISDLRVDDSPSYRIYDNHRLGTAVTSVSATDPDGVRYTITGNADAQSTFTINIITGEILLVAPLNRAAYQIRVTANDLGRPQRSNVTTVFVTVLPDPIPVFSQLRYRRNISDDVSVGYEVVRVSATEPNLQETVVYEAAGVWC
ncbi:protocadherin Fat 4-like [Liolophura sinensis]|uniref:protocadherin Fat 4-like n=1 Tax=Liolophura sinensis TaxID=3198878 RepID=UPI003158987B